MHVQILNFFFIACHAEEAFFPFVYQEPKPQVTVDTDSGIRDTGQSGLCPAGLVPIPPYEPEYCFMLAEAKIPDSGYGAVSQLGNYPSVNVSLLNAKKQCEETPVFQEGEIIGHMRLAHISEWRDAGDGAIGSGGTLFPWGDSLHVDQCVMGPEYDDFVASGTKDSCHSVFGVYDQIGNLWEWASTDAEASIEHWLAERGADGLNFSILNERLITQNTADEFDTFYIQGVGLNFDSFGVDSEGEVYVNGSGQDDRTTIVGYISLHEISLSNRLPKTGDMLPIEIEFGHMQNIGTLRVPEGRDMEPIGAKVGGAYYSGWDSTLQSIFFGHIPEFDGTIGFRCVSDPYP